MAGVKIGCTGFAGRRETYFRKYPVIEVEQTFYDPPRVFTAEKWRHEAADSFEFTVRAWQLITHLSSSPTYRRMQTQFEPVELEFAGHFQPTEIVWEGWQRTREIALAMKARTILFDCPDTFEPSAENKENMTQFFQRVHEEGRETQYHFNCAWIPPKQWSEPEIADISNELDLVHVVDPFKNATTTTGWCYFRLSGIKGYRQNYKDEELEQLMGMLQPFENGYCLFNHRPMREDAAKLAWMIRKSKDRERANRKEEEQMA